MLIDFQLNLGHIPIQCLEPGGEGSLGLAFPRTIEAVDDLEHLLGKIADLGALIFELSRCADEFLGRYFQSTSHIKHPFCHLDFSYVEL